jgi:hypothetical protein
VEAETLAAVKKKAKNEGRMIVDESGLSQRPHRCRTWAPRGQTPVLQYHFNWKMLSAIRGLELLLPAVSRSHSQPTDHRVPLPLAPAHSRQTADRLGWSAWPSQPCRVGLCATTERTPVAGVSPGLCAGTEPGRVVEYLWSHWKQHELPNFCPTTFGQLSHHARQALRRMRRRPTLVIAFWQQADLFPL